MKKSCLIFKEVNASCKYYLKNWDYYTSDDYMTKSTLERLFELIEKLTDAPNI